jgi:peptidoglycan/LPS O-acetylase OafA/YrhL
MIQRIQSVYLFLVVISLGAMFYFPLASFIGGDKDQLILYVYKLVSEVPDSSPDLPSWFVLPNLILTSLSLLISLIAIFMYKNRKMQLKMVRFVVILILGQIAAFFFYYAVELENASGILPEYEIGSYMPLVAFVFLILAYRGIMSDEKLIRSSERLR